MKHILLGRSQSGVGDEVGVDIFRPELELESKSLKIRRLCSPEKVRKTSAMLFACLIQAGSYGHCDDVCCIRWGGGAEDRKLDITRVTALRP